MQYHVIAAVLVASAAFVFARPQGLPFVLPDGVTDILDDAIDESFSCAGRPYGYYGDVNNNCQIFHVCVPSEDPETLEITDLQYTFACGNQTVFDQALLVCNHPLDATPCEATESLYGLVEFGKIDE